MISTRKYAVFSLFCLLIFISPLGAEPLYEPQPDLPQIIADADADTEDCDYSIEPQPSLTVMEQLDESSPLEEEPILSEQPSPNEGQAPVEELAFNEESFLDDFGDYLIYEALDFIFEVPAFEIRSFDEIFPNFSQNQKRLAMSGSGLRHSFENGGSPVLVPNPDSGIDLLSSVMSKRPSHIIEALALVPYNEKELDLLDIYNALGRIENIKEQLTPLRNGNFINIFKDTTRIENARNRRAVPDPLPADTLPCSETMFLRFTDAHIGNVYIRGDMSVSLYGITYSMTNFRDINFSIFRIMRAERVSIIIYLEPVKEGILIYSMSGLYLPGFIMNRVNLTPNVNARITSLIGWITEGLRIQENIEAKQENEGLIDNLLHNEHLNRLLRN
jgi:hypothetical protein